MEVDHDDSENCNPAVVRVASVLFDARCVNF